MTFAFISGLDAPDDAFDWLIGELMMVEPSSVCNKYKETDDFSTVTADCAIGHSFGAFEALKGFDDFKFKYTMLLDYVSKNWFSRLVLAWPTAKRSGALCLHRPSYWWIYPRSTGVKNAKDEIHDIGHDDFRTLNETRDHLVRFAQGYQWD